MLSVANNPVQTYKKLPILKSKRCSVTYVPKQIEISFDTDLVERTSNRTEITSEYTNDDIVKKSFFLWMICRLNLNENFLIPG